jgi:8-oxo-dGTP pyrophosphatase MutT (NUDIX family)
MTVTKKRADLTEITAAGGVLYRPPDTGREILLINRNGVWDLPKGKLESGESISECAAREVGEEVGIPVPAVICFLCSTYHEYMENESKIGKTTHWFAMVSEDQKGDLKMSPQREEGITELKWVQPDDAIKMVGYDNLKKVILAFIEQNKNDEST